ncbi:MAG: oligoendopeptidase F, partial [Candidatus Zixiibacteriota bacterium]
FGIDDLTPLKWSRIPHFYRAFYVYQYATSYAASQAILTRFLGGEADIIERYLNLLRSGGKNHPIALLQECGVDMTAPAPVQATLRLFADKVAELSRMV